MDERLAELQAEAARLYAEGKSSTEIGKAIGKGASTIRRWWVTPEFKKAAAEHKKFLAQKKIQEKASEVDNQDLEEAHTTEREQLEKLDLLINKLSSLSISLIDACDAEDISPRALPALLKAFTGLIDCRRTGADRITGIEVILDELNQAEEIFSEKIAPP